MADKKNVLLISPTLRQGGIERICVDTARILADDCRVTLMIFDGEGAHYDALGIDVVDLDLPASPSTIGKALTLLRRRRAVKRVKREHSVEVSYSFGMTANLSNAISRAGDMVITSLHSSLDFGSVRRMRRILKGSDLTVSCAEELRRMAKERFGYDNTVLLRNPYDTEIIRAQAKEPVAQFAKPTGARRIVTMGRDDDAKGYWHLIKAFYTLRQSVPNVQLMIIGGGAFRREKGLIAALGLSKDVIFTGLQKNPFPALATGDLFALSSNREGFPNALVEAMALGLPVVAADCKTGPREIVLSKEECDRLYVRFPDGASTRDDVEGSFGFLTPDMSATPDYDADRLTPDDKMFATAMKRMLSDPARMERYGASARKRAEDFGVDAYRDALLKIING